MDLEKFWLGNVDERGEIDKEQGYDDDEKDGLLRTTKNEGLTKGAVNDEDTRRDQDDEFAVDTVAKAQEAVDYSQEEEAVVDDAQAGSSDYYYSGCLSSRASRVCNCAVCDHSTA